MTCAVVLSAGALVLRTEGDDPPTAVRVDAAGVLPPGPRAPEPQPAPAFVSLAELAREAQSRTSTTPTTRARAAATSTTRPKPSTTTTSPPRTTPTTRPAGPPAISPPTTTPLTPLTTLLEKVVPPAAAVSRALTNSDSGVASWFKAPAATCAHRTLPMGTMVKVVRVSNGASATCTVDDRGPTIETGRLIDLSLDTFEKLADRGTGLIDVTIHW